MSAAYVLDAVRSPFGRYGGGLSHVRPDDLGAHVVRALLDRAPELDPARVDDVLFGDANQAGEDNRNVARMAWLLNGLPTSVPGATINRLCGSSLDAAMQASRAIETGDASIVLVGGVESMSRAPWVLLKTERPFPREHQQLHSSTLGWRMVNPKMPEQWTISLGQSAEKLAGLYGVTREAQDEFALRSHQRARGGLGGRLLREVGRPDARHRARARREHPPGHHARAAREAEARVRRGRDRDRRELLAAERRRRRDADRRRGRREGRRTRAARADRLAWRGRESTRTCSGSLRWRPPTPR